MVIDIRSDGVYPANVLSNFYPNAFEIDGVRCASMEGFLQSLKSRKKEEQEKICTLCGLEAKNYFKGKFANIRWKITGTLFWQGKKLRRKGDEYGDLLKRAYKEMSKAPEFATALAAAQGKILVHSVGKHRKSTTVLTEEEFLLLLEDLRDRQSEE